MVQLAARGDISSRALEARPPSTIFHTRAGIRGSHQASVQDATFQLGA
jgi:hypothetical protein